MGVFEDLLRDLEAKADTRPRRQPHSTPKPPAPKAPVSNPMPTIRGRHEDNVLWVRAADVADALEALSPTVNARLIKKLRG